MLEFLFGKKEQETARDVNLNKIYDELKKAYPSTAFRNLEKILVHAHSKVWVFNILIPKSSRRVD